MMGRPGEPATSPGQRLAARPLEETRLTHPNSGGPPRIAGGQTLPHSAAGALAAGALCTAIAVSTSSWPILLVGLFGVAGAAALAWRHASQLSERGAWLEDALERTTLDADTARADAQAARAEAQAADATRAAFLASMSHEIRTPLNGILGMADILAATELDGRQRRHLHTLRRSGEVLLRVLSDTLEASALQGFRFQLAHGPVHIARRVQAAIDRHEDADSPPVGLRIDPHMPTEVAGDARRFEQLISILVGNAVKFGEGSPIRVSVRPTAEDGVRVSVTDEGPGIPEDKQQQVFEPFVQGDGSATRAHGGAGLGLAIAAGIVRAMGGQIGLQAEAGRGTKVWFTVPMPAWSDSQPTLRLQRPQRRRGRGVLVVEDNPVSAMVARGLLERFGLDASVVDNGEGAVDAARADTHALVLMDCELPGIDGYEATRRLRALGVKVPIVGCTANAMPEDRARCLDAGMDDYLAKPIRLSALRGLLARWAPDTLPMDTLTPADQHAAGHVDSAGTPG